MPTTAHHSVIQMKVHRVLGQEESIEPSTGGAGFYSNVFVAPQHFGWVMTYSQS